MTREQCATPNWDEAKAQERMDNILTTYYTGANVDAVLCSNDSVSLGVQSALKSAGYNTASKKMPVITGQDANLPNVKAIIAGEQSMSVFKDTRALADEVVKMVEAVLNKQEPEVNNTKDYDNGVKIVPSYLLEPKFVDASNYKALLIDSGYYTEAELQK
jgi:multiple sugar transport system (multiplesugar-binding protein)